MIDAPATENDDDDDDWIRWDDDADPEAAAENRRSGSHRSSKESVRTIARRQKAVILCIVVNLLCGVAFAVAMAAVEGPARQEPDVPSTEQTIVLIGILFASVAIAAANAYFVGRLAAELYGTSAGIVLGACSLLGCIGSIILLVVNQAATSRLQAAGLRVGLLGAKMSRL